MRSPEEARAAFRRGETALTERPSREELARARASADVAAEVEALSMLARVAVRGDDPAEAQRLALTFESAYATGAGAGLRALLES